MYPGIRQSRWASASASSLRHERADQLAGAGGPGADEQGQIGGDLVVARAAGVQLAADRPDQLGEPPLDRHVDVLVVGSEVELAALELGGDQPEPALELRELIGRDHPGALEPRGVRARSLDVLAPEAPVEADRGVDAREQWVGRPFEAGHGR